MSDRSTYPRNVFELSYLQKAGIRFDLNIIDTVCRRGLSISFFGIFALLVVLCCLALVKKMDFLPSPKYFFLLLFLCVFYLVTTFLRYTYYLRLRKKIRLEDTAPITVEAYAIVVIDLNRNGKKIKPRKSAIIYKESGSNKPRFFTTAVTSGLRQRFKSGQIARVFSDKKNKKIYSIDDGSAYQTVTARRKLWGRLPVAMYKTIEVEEQR